MRLLTSPSSPFARKVRIALFELEMLDEVELVQVLPLKSDETLTTANPLGKVPTLILPNGLSIFDSPSIVRYLDSLTGGKHLCPRDHSSPSDLMLEPLSDGIASAAFSIVMEKRRASSQQSDFWLDRWHQAIGRSIQYGEANLSTLKVDWRSGQIAMACALEYLDFRLPDLRWRDRFPHLSSWVDEVAQQPSMLATQLSDS